MYNSYFNDTWYQNMIGNSMRNSSMNNNSLFTPDEGYINGNLFSNLYSQYKNYRPVQLSAKNEREKMLLDIQKLAFAAHDINLYLDLNPNDESMLTLFNDYRSQVDQLMRQYEDKYGALSISSNSLDKSPFGWIDSPWPWEEDINV